MRKRTVMITGCLLAAVMFGLTACTGAEGQEPAQTPEIVQTEPTSEEQNTNVNEPEETETTEPDTTMDSDPAADFVESIDFGWNLGNTLDSYSGTELGKNEGLSSETAWGNPKTTQELIDLVRDSGINAVRVPVTWYNHMDSNYVIDEEWMDRVQEVVDYVIDNDMYCIINVHHDTGANGWLRASDTNLEENKAMFAAIWEQISARFAEYDDHLLFEGFNEILNDNNEWVNPDSRAVEIVNELNQLFVDTVRASGGNNGERVLIVNTYCAGGNSQVTAGFVLPTDSVANSLVVEAHIYQPYYFTAEEFSEVTSWSKEAIDSYLSNMYVSFVQKGIPVIIGEFGCVDKENAEDRLSWAKYYVETCREYGIKCFWWDNGAGYKLFSRRNLKIAEMNLLGMLIATAKGEEYVLQTAEEEEPTDNMCADIDKWSCWVNSDAKAVVTYLPDGLSIEVTESGAEAWYIQGSYVGLTLEQGASYEISFDYLATTDITLPYCFQQNYDPYGAYASGSADFKQETQHYSDVFTMKEETDKNVVLVFNCGKNAGSEPYTMTVTNWRIVRTDKGE
ncbi:MAG: cellulase family glycosylhydrolase [Lachnospiraceae bacterium]|nr:cellulase family glycosylhydrolase [Lachnospiraceae bacterium]